MKTTITLAFSMLTLFCSPLAYGDTCGSDSNIFDIEFVTIGNPGNAADEEDGDSLQPGVQNFGSVDYEYRIGKYEISEDMIAKANDAGALGITRFIRGPNKPATGVTWLEAARFVNWLNTSTGSLPAYKFNGDSFQLWAPGDVGYNPDNLFRNSQATYFLPTVDEWYKAAYHDVSAGTAGTYFDYSTGSDTAPAPVASGTDANTAVYDVAGAIVPADVTLAGGLSPYGTMAQSGNVWEWEETNFELVNDSTSSDRGVRGGGWFHPFGDMQSSARLSVPPETISNIGFRVVSIVVPEPTTCGLTMIATLCLVLGRRRYCC